MNHWLERDSTNRSNCSFDSGLFGTCMKRTKIKSRKRFLSVYRAAVPMVFPLVLSVCLSACYFATAEYSETMDITHDASQVVTMQAKTSNGAIAVVGTDGNQCVLHAIKTVRAYTVEAAQQIASQVSIDTENIEDAIHITNSYPTLPPGVQVSVSYEIQIPKTVALQLETSNGRIGMEGFTSSVMASTSNGAIDLNGGNGDIWLQTSNGQISVRNATGRIEAETSNGQIEFNGSAETLHLTTSNGRIVSHLNQLDNEGVIETSNGAVEVYVPADFTGNVKAKTSNGSLSCDLPVEILEGSFKEGEITARIGENPTRSLKLETSNGSLSLMKR